MIRVLRSMGKRKELLVMGYKKTEKIVLSHVR